MGKDFPTAPEPTICVNKTAMNICIATEGFSAFQAPWVVSSLGTLRIEDLHTVSSHAASFLPETVYLTGYCHHQPDSKEEKQEI